MIRVLIVRPGQNCELTMIDPSLDIWQEIVGGWIKMLYLSESVALFWNEDALGLGLPLNRLSPWTRDPSKHFTLRGTFVVFRANGSEEESLSDEDVARWRAWFDSAESRLS